MVPASSPGGGQACDRERAVAIRPAFVTAILLTAVADVRQTAAQAPQQSDVPPAVTRLAWEETGYASGPERSLHLPLLEQRRFFTYGWIEAGIGANNWGSPFNGPVTLADRAWQGQLNQLYLVTERETDGADGWDWGGRVDLLFGTDYLFTTARGLDAYWFQETGTENVAAWDFSKDYGVAMPQLYADFARAGFNLRFGHFYSILGYEQVPAVGNFFYSHCFSMQFSPFTFTGFLGSWQPHDQLAIYAGIHNGWNNFSDPMRTTGPWALKNREYPGAGSTAGFLGGIDFATADGQQTLSIMTTSGNERTPQGIRPRDGSLVGNRSLISTVYTNKLTDRLTYVFQNDNAWQFNADVTQGNTGQQPGLAQWYSFLNYLFWKFNDQWVGGVRLEYFRDNNGYIVTAPIRNASVLGSRGYWASDFAGNFWELTLGLNYYRSRNVVIRPELRYDWFAPNAASTKRPYGKPLGQEIGAGGDRLGQFYAGCDMIWQW
jgi:hypothetical protein